MPNVDRNCTTAVGTNYRHVCIHIRPFILGQTKLHAHLQAKNAYSIIMFTLYMYRSTCMYFGMDTHTHIHTHTHTHTGHELACGSTIKASASNVEVRSLVYSTQYSAQSSVLQRVTVLQCVAAQYKLRPPTSRSGVLEVHCSALQCIAVCCNVLRCITMCCRVLPCVGVCCNVTHLDIRCFEISVPTN